MTDFQDPSGGTKCFGFYWLSVKRHYTFFRGPTTCCVPDGKRRDERQKNRADFGCSWEEGAGSPDLDGWQWREEEAGALRGIAKGEVTDVIDSSVTESRTVGSSGVRFLAYLLSYITTGYGEKSTKFNFICFSR